MALTNSQFDSLMREYEVIQFKNKHELDDRFEEVYKKLPGYRDLEDAVSTLSLSYGKQLLGGDTSALSDLKNALHDLSDKKTKMLQNAGFSADYLQMHYNCPDCQDTGYIGNQKCHCLERKMISLMYNQSGIQSMLDSENFSSLSDEYYKGEDLDRFHRAVRISHEFVEQFDTSHDNLFLYGNVGTGKSFLSGCIAKALLDSGHSVIYFSSCRLFDELSNHTFNKDQKETLYSMYEDIYNCDLVIIDDLGTELFNSFVATRFFTLLNERFLRNKSTIISTNLSLEELREKYSDRIFSRITNNYKLCKLSGPDIRIYKKRTSIRK